MVVLVVVVVLVVPRKSLFYICKVEMANKRCSQYACLSFSNALVALVDYSTIDNVQYMWVHSAHIEDTLSYGQIYIYIIIEYCI